MFFGLDSQSLLHLVVLQLAKTVHMFQDSTHVVGDQQETQTSVLTDAASLLYYAVHHRSGSYGSHIHFTAIRVQEVMRLNFHVEGLKLRWGANN